MKTTIAFEGYLDLVLQRAVDLGIARSKTDAIRLGVFELNNKYHLAEQPETNLVIKKMQKLDDETRAGKRKTLSEEDVLKKYPHLRKTMKG
ncbi:TPA: hypothetical protein HA244_01545 [Candidatus Micrarchaeota archaeon]|nr:hypothetical protein [Candidatus Micrarchaeota archaeon]